MNSRAKGARGELEFIQRHLVEHWPEAKRNLDQFGDDKRDSLGTDDIHWQIKRAERLSIWAALEQAETEAAPGALAVVAFRRNHSPWYIALRAADGVPALARELKRDLSSGHIT